MHIPHNRSIAGASSAAMLTADRPLKGSLITGDIFLVPEQPRRLSCLGVGAAIDKITHTRTHPETHSLTYTHIHTQTNRQTLVFPQQRAIIPDDESAVRWSVKGCLLCRVCVDVSIENLTNDWFFVACT